MYVALGAWFGWTICGSFFFQAEDGIRDGHVTGVQTCALPISSLWAMSPARSELSTRSWTSVSIRRAPVSPSRARRSEERRVGKECRWRGCPYRRKKQAQACGAEAQAYMATGHRFWLII